MIANACVVLETSIVYIPCPVASWPLPPLPPPCDMEGPGNADMPGGNPVGKITWMD